jgi:YlmC/YmxH family sporulation protein
MGVMFMRFKDISSKEIVNINEGERLGILGQTDLEINETTGQIEAFIIPTYKWFGLKKEGEMTKIRWSEVKKIGEDMIMVEMKNNKI